MGYSFHAEPRGEIYRGWPGDHPAYGADFPVVFWAQRAPGGIVYVEALLVKPPAKMDRELHEAIDDRLRADGHRLRGFARYRGGLVLHWRDLVTGRQWVDRK